MGAIALILLIVCLIGIITEKIALGIVFVISVIMSLYCLITLINSKLTKFGVFIFVCNLCYLIYTICVLFFNIDVIAILGI